METSKKAGIEAQKRAFLFSGIYTVLPHLASTNMGAANRFAKELHKNIVEGNHPEYLTEFLLQIKQLQLSIQLQITNTLRK